MAIHEQYTGEILEQLNYNATWLPTVRLEPGDVCTMKGHELKVVSNLSEFKVTFELEERPVQSDFEYSSAGAVSIQLKAKGESPPAGSAFKIEDAGISLSFSRAQAVVLRMAQCSAKRIKSLHAVGEQVLKLHGSGKWPNGYVVVGEIVSAGASTIIISSGDNAGIDLSAKGALGTGALTLASIDAGFQVTREAKIGAKFVAMPGLTPLVRVSGVRKHFLRDDEFMGKVVQSPFGSMDYADFDE